MRKVYIVPNFVTTIGMMCGFFAMISAMRLDYINAAWAILAAAVFDMLDGRIARLAKATSNFGVQYDSLADLISFGMAPAILVYSWALEPFGRLGWLASFLFVVCAALRLARFNVSTGKAPKNYFQGLPTPTAALTIATFIIFNRVTDWPALANEQTSRYFSLGLVLVLSSLMISEILFPSFKELNWRSRASFGILMVAVMATVLIAVRPEFALFLVLISYVVLSLGWNLVLLSRSRNSTTARKASLQK